LLRSPVFRLATADLFFLSLSGKVTARSLKSIRLEFQAMAHAAGEVDLARCSGGGGELETGEEDGLSCISLFL
jgi:hypothetical protein